MTTVVTKVTSDYRAKGTTVTSDNIIISDNTDKSDNSNNSDNRENSEKREFSDNSDHIDSCKTSTNSDNNDNSGIYSVILLQIVEVSPRTHLLGKKS